LADPVLVAALFIGLSAAHWGLLNLADVRWLRWVLGQIDPNRFFILKAVFSWQVALLVVFLSVGWAIYRLVIQWQPQVVGEVVPRAVDVVRWVVVPRLMPAVW
jgi:hypothetical protein